jgi:hypothetical protein
VDDLTWLSWIDTGRTVAALLVAIGVSAEFLLGFIASPIQKRIDAARTAELATLNKDIAQANERAAEANKKAEEERLARIKIEEKMAWRHLSPEQQERIEVKLRPFAGERANVFIYSGDNEINGIANEIGVALGGPKGAQWIVSGAPEQPSGFTVSGILVEWKSTADTKAKEAANSLVSALKAEHLAVAGPSNEVPRMRVTYGHADDAAQIVITIGKKP